jgi:hypothetical protein
MKNSVRWYSTDKTDVSNNIDINFFKDSGIITDGESDYRAGLLTIYNNDLHESLRLGKLVIKEEIREKFSSNNSGIYLMMLRYLNKDKNTIIYNYIFYPEIFVNSLLLYLIKRLNKNTSLFYRDWGDFYCLIDSDLGDDSNKFIGHMKNNYITYNHRFKDSCLEIVRNTNISNATELDFISILDFFKTIVDIKDISIIVKQLDLIIKKDYIKFSKGYLDYMNNSEIISYYTNCLNSIYKDKTYLLKDSLFVIKDKDILIKRLKDMGYYVHKDYPDMKFQLNTMGGFLYNLDSDYRESLYNLYSRNFASRLSSEYKLSRSSFSFNNLHYNVVEWDIILL